MDGVGGFLTCMVSATPQSARVSPGRAGQQDPRPQQHPGPRELWGCRVLGCTLGARLGWGWAQGRGSVERLPSGPQKAPLAFSVAVKIGQLHRGAQSRGHTVFSAASEGPHCSELCT